MCSFALILLEFCLSWFRVLQKPNILKEIHLFLHWFLRLQAARGQYSFKQHSCVIILVQMWQIVNVTQDIIGIVTELLQSQLEYSERNVLVFATVVLHQCCCHKDLIHGPSIFAGPLEHGPRTLYTLSAAGEFHVLHISLKKSPWNHTTVWRQAMRRLPVSKNILAGLLEIMKFYLRCLLACYLPM